MDESDKRYELRSRATTAGRYLLDMLEYMTNRKQMSGVIRAYRLTDEIIADTLIAEALEKAPKETPIDATEPDWLSEFGNNGQ